MGFQLMERIVYDRMAELDERHWWYRARRDILATLITRKIKLPADARILEIGCGTGHNLQMLARFGEVDGIELDGAARAVAERRLGRSIGASPLPELEGVPDAAYDLVAVLDVIEHVAEDRASLLTIARKLKPGGRILITVPAHQWMWSAHDEVNHHKRRYSARSLRELIEGAGLHVHLLSPFNALLFPLAAVVRLAGKLTGRESSDDALPPAPLNTLFEKLFGLERYAIGRAPFPPGVSLVAIASAAT
jgi:SAM-dependent methyltransferase